MSNTQDTGNDDREREQHGAQREGSAVYAPRITGERDQKDPDGLVTIDQVPAGENLDEDSGAGVDKLQDELTGLTDTLIERRILVEAAAKGEEPPTAAESSPSPTRVWAGSGRRSPSRPGTGHRVGPGIGADRLVRSH